MKSSWKQTTLRSSTAIFERTLFPFLSGLAKLYQATATRRMWGDLIISNSIHPSAFCNRIQNVEVYGIITIGAGCRFLIKEQGRISLNSVHLEPNVTLTANVGTIEIGRGTYINVGTFLWTEGAKLTLGRQVLVGAHCVFSAANHGIQSLGQYIMEQPITSRGITVGDNVWLGAGVIVCDGVTIGEGTVIAAGAVVTKDMPAHVVAGGVPCRVLRTRDA